MNFDETLAFVAADIIADAYKGRKIPFAHRQGIFQLVGLEEGLRAPVLWTTRTVHDPYTTLEMELPDCVCPDWMDCYCGGREVDEDTTSD